jgi:hypothetical protein
MAVLSRAVTVTTSATRLDSDFDQRDTLSGSRFACHNASAVTVYVGGDDVTTANGLSVPAGAQLSIDLSIADQVYGIVAAGTAEVRVLETGI